MSTTMSGLPVGSAAPVPATASSSRPDYRRLVLPVAPVVGFRAGDLHDVVTHHISLVAVRAESAPFVQPQLGEPARRVLAEIADDTADVIAAIK